jgi:hypothetical protein
MQWCLWHAVFPRKAPKKVAPDAVALNAHYVLVASGPPFGRWKMWLSELPPNH